MGFIPFLRVLAVCEIQTYIISPMNGYIPNNIFDRKLIFFEIKSTFLLILEEYSIVKTNIILRYL